MTSLVRSAPADPRERQPHSVPVPALAPGVRLRHDPALGQTVLCGRERALVPDAVALAVLRRLDGACGVETLVHELATRFDAPPALVRADTLELLAKLDEDGWLAWR